LYGRMASMSSTRHTIRLKPDIEYQVVWSETLSHWELYRNGIKTNNARRKMQSAIDRAIAAVQAEMTAPKMMAVVSSFKDGIKNIEWRGRSGV